MGMAETPYPRSLKDLKWGWEAIQLAEVLHAQEKDSEWIYYDSPLYATQIPDWDPFEHRDDFSTFFSPLVPGNNPSLKAHIESYLAVKKGKAVGLELGGPGSRLFAGFTPGFFKNTLGVTLEDRRSDFAKKQDRRRNHDLLEADILDPTTLTKINMRLRGDRPDLIIERLHGPINILSTNPFFLAQKLNEYYAFLKPNGLMVLQTPRMPQALMRRWALFVAQTDRSIFVSYRDASYSDMIQVTKGQHAPDKLPFLSAKEVLELYRYEGMLK